MAGFAEEKPIKFWIATSTRKGAALMAGIREAAGDIVTIRNVGI